MFHRHVNVQLYWEIILCDFFFAVYRVELKNSCCIVENTDCNFRNPFVRAVLVLARYKTCLTLRGSFDNVWFIAQSAHENVRYFRLLAIFGIKISGNVRRSNFKVNVTAWLFIPTFWQAAGKPACTKWTFSPWNLWSSSFLSRFRFKISPLVIIELSYTLVVSNHLYTVTFL